MTIAFVGSTQGADTGTVTRTPVAGNALIVQLFGIGAGAVLTSITDSVGGDIVLTDFGFTVDPTSGFGFAIVRVNNVTAVSHTFTANWSTAPSDWFLTCTEVSGLSSLDTGAGTISVAHAGSGTPTTGSLTPTVNGDFVLAALAQNGSGSNGAFTNGFTGYNSITGGPTLTSAYLIQSAAASVNTAWTTGLGGSWAAVLAAYSPPVGPPPQPLFYNRKTVLYFIN